MDAREQLRTAAALSLVSLALLLMAVVLTLISGGAATQEQFEIFADPAKYTAALREAGQSLRLLLAVDDLFIVAYAGALGFAALGLSSGRRAAGWTAGLGAFLLGAFDFWENLTMSTSLDMAMNGLAIDAGRIASQVAISTAKWNAAAVALVALTFAFPKERFCETLLAWATRLIFPAATALFVTGALDIRGLSRFAIYAGMISGFVLISIVTYGRSREGTRWRGL